jgi:hypothetical protein
MIPITALTGLILVFLGGGVLHYQFGRPGFGAEDFFTERPSVPLVVLSYGPWLQVLNLWLVERWRQRHDSLSFVLSGPPGDRRAVRDPVMERAALAVVVGLPLVLVAYWWVRFHHGQAWDSTSLALVGLYDLRGPPWQFLVDANLFRYGLAPPVGPVAPGAPDGVSFGPFWQPVVIMGGGTACMAWFSIRVLRMGPRRG